MKKKLFILASVALLLFSTSCENQSGTSTLNLSITDSPIDTSNVTGVFISVTEIQIHSSDSNWKSLGSFDMPKTFNLLDLTRGESDLLGNFALEGGRYTQIRFMLDAPVRGTGKPSSPGCYIRFKDDSTEPLYVPSGSQSGFKAVGEFTVPINGSVEVTADFDVRKSIVKTGSGTPMYILKPMIRLVVDNEAGQIRGNVTNIPQGTGIIVYAYADGTYKSEESDTPASETTRFPNAVSSDLVDSLGVYHIAYLAAGKYDLIVTSQKDNSFAAVLGIVENVSVESGITTKQDIDIALLE